MLRHIKATLLIRERTIFEDGAIVDIKIWRVPDPVPPTTHRLKYSLFYGHDFKADVQTLRGEAI